MPEYKISIETQPDSGQVNFVDKQLHEFNVGIQKYLYINQNDFFPVSALKLLSNHIQLHKIRVIDER